MIYNRFRNQKCGLLDGLFSAFGNVGSTVIGTISAKNQQEREQEFNAEQAELNRQYQTSERLAAQEFDLEMWNRNNEYNSIGAQLQRARDAGVNPASILGGDYKSAMSDPVTTTPMSGATASSNSAGAIGSAMLGSYSNMIGNTANALKALAEGKATNELLAYNIKEIQSRVDYNYASIQKMAYDNGLTEVTRQQVEKSIKWMDGLNDSEIKRRAAQSTLMYNQSYESYQRILKMRNDIAVDNANLQQNIKESESRIAVNTAQASYTSTLEDFQENRNLYADELNQAELTQQEVLALEAEKRKEFAELYNIPLGSSEFEFAWQLQLQGKYEEYCDKVIAPAEQSKWKPSDYSMPTAIPGSSVHYKGSFNGRKGIMNPNTRTFFPDITDPWKFWK